MFKINFLVLILMGVSNSALASNIVVSQIETGKGALQLEQSLKMKMTESLNFGSVQYFWSIWRSSNSFTQIECASHYVYESDLGSQIGLHGDSCKISTSVLDSPIPEAYSAYTEDIQKTRDELAKSPPQHQIKD
jgi:hypothetical protein